MRWLVVIAVAAAGAAILLVLPFGRHGGRTVTAQASLAPRTILFGDATTATVRITEGDGGSARVTAQFDPFTVVSRRAHGGLTSFTLRCLKKACLPHPGQSVRFAPAVVHVQDRMLRLPWPALHVVSRLGEEDLKHPAFRADIASPPPRSLRVEPRTLGRALAGAAAMLVLGGGAAAVVLLRPRRQRGQFVREPGVSLSPVAQAANRVEHAAGAPETERRRALDALAAALEATGAGALARRARALAWSRRPPQPQPMRDLAEATRRTPEEK